MVHGDDLLRLHAAVAVVSDQMQKKPNSAMKLEMTIMRLSYERVDPEVEGGGGLEGSPVCWHGHNLVVES